VRLDDALALANASLSTIAIVCMIRAYFAIRAKRVAQHRNLMLAAAGASAVFLCLFVLRFVRFGFAHFRGGAVLHGIYYFVFFSHEPLAVINVPLVLCALVLGLRRSFRAHKEVARMALPVWLYVAVTGVILYVLLYVRQ
jgi:putative membrane protein